ncbi:class I SAM-dependent methyltransferase [Brasilonema bromeliae]|nr:class I SAM-dependent methyltransferase [Brasilonema bromeliae]
MTEAISRSKYLIKRLIFVFDPLYVSFYRIFNNYYAPIPPMENRVRVGAHYKIGGFLKSGRNCYEPIKKSIVTYQSNQINHLKILDFGAGCGRTLQFFYPDIPKIFATDVDSSAINYLSKAFPEANASCNQYDPPLKYDDNFFDTVYSVSIWTHLPVSKQKPWLNEISRILKPNGLALITVLGDFSLTIKKTKNMNLDVTPEKLEKEGILYLEYPGVNLSSEMRNKLFPGIDQSYGTTYHSEKYIREEWSDNFEVLDIQKGVIDNLQDLVILRKNGSSNLA